MYRPGIQGAGVIPVCYKGNSGGAPPLDFDFDVFTAGMAKRGGTGVFAAAPIVQGKWDGSGVPDVLSLSRGTLFGNPTQYTYADFDPAQGQVVLWWTPERDSGAGGTAYVWYISAAYYLSYNYTTGTFTLCVGTQTMTRAQAATAGTKILVTAGWDTQRKLDGTNYARLGTNNTFTYGVATKPTLSAPASTIYVGSTGAASPSNAIIEGLTIYRRPLYDSNGYGVAGTFDASGPVDEIGAIYAAGAGQDPCLVTGSWDCVLALPTNSTEGALVTGTGEAWSHPHTSNILNKWTLSDAFYGGGQWAVGFNGTSSYINCGSAAALDDLGAGGNEFTVEAWVRLDASSSGTFTIAHKGSGLTGGWALYVGADNYAYGYVDLVTTNVQAYVARNVRDGKWHHIVFHYDDATKTGRLATDGAWGAANVGAGNYVTDAADNLEIGRLTSLSSFWSGAIGWVRLSNNDRHTAGTNFIPPREFPAADGNTVEAWSLADGTGATAAAQVTSPGNDGTITSGTWEQQWDDVDTPVIPTSLEFDGSATILDGTSGANIDNLPSGANGFTAEGWFRHDTAGESNTGTFWTKTGWYMRMASVSTVRVFIDYDTTDINETFSWTPDGKWHHWLLTYNENGADRFARVYRDGVLVHTTAASVGNYAGDAANTFYVGNNAGATATMDGAIGSQELSDVVRESAAFVPASRIAPRANDANMHLRYAMTDGAGTSVADTSGNAYTGTITMGSGRWWNRPDMENTAPGSRVYQWGYDIGSDAANDGIHQHKASLTAGANYVARIPVRYEADKRAQPSIVAYDETNGAAITTFNGPWLTGSHDGGDNVAALSDSTAPYWPYSLVGGKVYNITDVSSATITAAGTSITGALAGGTDNDWDNGDVYFIVPKAGWEWAEPFCFELPTIARNGAAADCTHISFRLLNSAGEGVIYWQQVELLANLIDNPSLETPAAGANPWIPDGWTNDGLDPGDSSKSVVVHSGSSAIQYNAGATIEGINQIISETVGKFYSFGMWAYSDGSNDSPRLYTAFNRTVRQTTLATGIDEQNQDAMWKILNAVGRSTGLGGLPYILGDSGIGAACYADDFYQFALNDVSLTVTPASEANSAETTGLRVDGQDLCSWTPPVGRLLPVQGWLRWNWTPRHDAADLALFAGAANLPYIVEVWGDANNRVIVEVTAANTIQLDVTANAVNATANWNCAGAIVAGTTYQMEVRWDGAWFRFIVNSAVVAQVTPAVMTTTPTIVYWGCDATPAHEADGTYAAP